MKNQTKYDIIHIYNQERRIGLWKKKEEQDWFAQKKLNNGIVERFEVVVASNERDIAKKKYESIGYTVSVKK